MKGSTETLPVELLYEERPRVTEAIGYGVDLTELMAGKPPGPEGARFDLHFAVEEISGRLSGRGKGVVSLMVQPNGMSVVEIRETLTTPEGENVLIRCSGVALPGEEAGDLAFKGSYGFHTSAAEYSWLNTVVGLGQGGGNPLRDNVVVRVYAWV